MGLALFDADGTLYPNPSSESRFVRRLLRKGWLGPRQAWEAMYFMFRGWPRYGRHTARKNKAYLTGLPVDEIQAEAALFVEEELLPVIRPSLEQRIEEHRRAGDTVILLTGAPEFIAHPLQRHLAMDHHCATRLAVRDGRFLAAPPLRHPLGAEKLSLARSLAESLGIPSEQWTAYGDSRFDIPLLQTCGRAVAVTPDPVLEKTALQEGWEILEARRASLVSER